MSAGLGVGGDPTGIVIDVGGDDARDRSTARKGGAAAPGFAV